MGKLTSLKSSLPTLGPRVGYVDNVDRRIAERPTWRSWYNTAKWKDLRMECLVRDLFTCQKCIPPKMFGDTSKLVADHKIPHRGRRELFFDLNNLQTLCVHCHASVKQKEEQEAPPGNWY